MLDLGHASTRTCQALGRRAFLRLGTLGMAGLTLGDLLAVRSLRAAEAASSPARIANSTNAVPGSRTIPFTA